MPVKISPFFFQLSLVFSLNAQTPLIMHKRLGGANENFTTYMQKPDALIRQSNFGLPPTIFVKRAVIDSIIAINDSSVLVITSHQLVEDFHWTPYDYDSIEGTFVCSDSMLQKSLTYDSTGLWKPGRDLMVNHPVFNTKMGCDDILLALHRQFNLQNATRNTVFVGFRCFQRNQKNRNNMTWIGMPFPKDPNSWFGLILVISLLYFILLKIKQLKAFKLA